MTQDRFGHLIVFLSPAKEFITVIIENIWETCI